MLGMEVTDARAGFHHPLAPARNLSSLIPETPNPMIRAITAARTIMTMVRLFGEKKDNITMQPTSLTPGHTCRAAGGKEVEAGELKP